MCNIIYIYYQFCGHREYSNTCLCPFALGKLCAHPLGSNCECHMEHTLARAMIVPVQKKKKDLLEQINEQLTPETRGPPPPPPKDRCTKRCPIRPLNEICPSCKRLEAQRRNTGVVANASAEHPGDNGPIGPLALQCAVDFLTSPNGNPGGFF